MLMQSLDIEHAAVVLQKDGSTVAKSMSFEIDPDEFAKITTGFGAPTELRTPEARIRFMGLDYRAIRTDELSIYAKNVILIHNDSLCRIQGSLHVARNSIIYLEVIAIKWHQVQQLKPWKSWVIDF